MADKILLTTMALDIGGAETHITELAKALKKSGYDVTVASNGGVYVSELTDAGVKHVCIPLHSKKPCFVLQSYCKLKALIKKEKFDVVHAHARIPAFLCGLLAKQLKFRFVTSAHGTYDVSLFWKLISNWGERTLAVSYDIKEYLINHYKVPSDTIAITINGIDTNRYCKEIDTARIMDEFGLQTGGRRVLYVSRIDHEAAHVGFFLVQAAKELAKEYPDLQIVLVGGGTAFAKLKQEVEAANEQIGRRVLVLTGARTDINHFCAWADIFVGVSRAALEAMSAECVTILSGSQGNLGLFGEHNLQDALDTNFTCRGRPMADASTLQAYLREVFALSCEERAAMGAYNRSIVQTYYSIDKMAKDAMDVYQAMKPYKQYRQGDVLLNGYYGFGNKGDDALLQVIIEHIRAQYPNARLTVLSRRPKLTKRMFGVHSINRFHPIMMARVLRRGKVLIYGGGSLLQSVTSSRSLLYYTWVLRLAKYAGIRTMLFANGIGPFASLRDQKRAADALAKVDSIIVRDAASLQTLDSLGVNTEQVFVTADPVFCLKGADQGWCRHWLAKAGLAPGEAYFAISMRRWKWLDKDFEDKIVQFCLYVKKQYGLVPLFLSMQKEKDWQICSTVSARAGGLCIEALSSSELHTIVSQAAFVCGMRLHLLICAAAAGVPVIGIAYDPKVNALFADLENHKLLPASQIDEETLKSFADEAVKEDRILLQKKAQTMREKAEESFAKMDELLREALG
ncbi:MAG: polysaccharide pyruvyl transferase CsaB [Clostridiales bacterium]|nr:polysaccharide pyruvyl transferase CsaB [Clostridiales bacterium]